MSKKDPEDLRVRLVRREYLKQVPPDKRVETFILEFHEWLFANRPHLLSTVRESYQHLKVDLRGLYKLYK